MSKYDREPTLGEVACTDCGRCYPRAALGSQLVVIEEFGDEERILCRNTCYRYYLDSLEQFTWDDMAGIS